MHKITQTGVELSSGILGSVPPELQDGRQREGRPAASAPAGRVGGAESKLVDGWCEFLDRWDWPWFCTFTFRDYVHPEQADRRFRRLVYEMNRTLYPYRLKQSKAGREVLDLKGEEGVYWTRALEWQRRGVLHYHALMGGVGLLRRLSWMDRWNEMAGFAKIEPPADEFAVRRYVSKYVLKRSRLGEIDMGGRLTRFKPFMPRLAG